MDDSCYMEPLLCCFPNRPEPLIAQIITCYMTFGTPQEDSKRTLACALRMLLSFHCPLKEMSLFLSTKWFAAFCRQNSPFLCSRIHG